MFENLISVILDHSVLGKQPFHPLHISVSQEDIKKFHVDYSGKCIKKEDTIEFVGALFKKNPSFSKLHEGLFVTVHVFDLPSDADESDFLHLHVTPTFLNHYSLAYNDIMFFKCVSGFPISKVVFGAKHSNSYDWTKTSLWHQQLLLSACQTKTLCRMGDILLASPMVFSIKDASMFFDFVTLDCQPVSQGILTVNSTVVITNISETAQCTKIPETNMISSLNLVNYASSIHLPVISHVLPIKGASVVSRPISPCLNLQVQIIPKLSPGFRKALSDIEALSDPLNTIFLNDDVLAKLGIQQGCWVKVKVLSSVYSSTLRKCPKQKNSSFDSNEERLRAHSGKVHMINSKKPNYRLAFVCRFLTDNQILHSDSDGVAYLSPHLWFNMNQHPSKLIQPDVRINIEPFTCKSDNPSPPYAKEVYVTLVQSPHYNGTISCGTMLSNYFRTPKYICKGDIFCVSTKVTGDFQQRNDESDNIKWPVIFFRVSMIEGVLTNGGYLIDKENCKLYQAGTTQSYIPVTMETYYSPYSDHPLWDSPVPLGMKGYVDVLQEVIIPFLNLQNTRFQVSSNVLISGSTCCGKTTVVRAICKCLNLHLYQINCHELLGESSATTEARLKIIIEKASVYAPCIMLLKNIDSIGKEKELKGENSRVLSTLSELLKNVNSSEAEWPVVAVATTSQLQLLSNDLASAFLHHIHMQPPTEEERSLVIDDLLSACSVSNHVSSLYVAQRTAGFVLGDLMALTSEAIKTAYSRVRKLLLMESVNSIIEEEDIYMAGMNIIQQDLLYSLEKLQADYAEAIGAPKIPNIFWRDIGGLDNVKQEILDTIQLPLEHPEILLAGLRRSGVLLYGPPGTGKTLLAKAVATECSLNFLSVKGPELINMYVGQSEENVRAVFHQARSAVPCIIFFDELDSLAPNRGRSGDSGGVMDRVVSQLLSELDGLSKSAEVFVIGATNRPDLIDPALLRPGRFDRLLFVGIPEDKKSKLNILKALTRKLQVSEDVDLEYIVEKCPRNVSGADIYALCSDAMMYRIQKNVESIEKGDVKIEDANNLIQTEDFISALETLVPSVSVQELVHYQQIKQNL